MRRDDTKISPLANQSFSPITGTCHVTAGWFFVFCVCVLCGLFLFVCVFGLFLLLVLVVGVFCFPLERDRLIGLCIGPLPVVFCGPTAWPLRELIN